MIPSQILVVEDLPLTPNLKIDRKRLPDPASVFAKREARESRSPSTKTEELIKSVWEQVLGLSNINVNDNFFDIGGHSIRAVQVQGELRSLLKRPFPITDLFRFPTIETLAAYLDGGSGAQTDTVAADRAALRKKARARRPRRSRA